MIESAHEVLVLIALLSTKGPGDPAHMCRLVSNFVARMHKVWMLMENQANI